MQLMKPRLVLDFRFDQWAGTRLRVFLRWRRILRAAGTTSMFSSFYFRSISPFCFGFERFQVCVAWRPMRLICRLFPEPHTL